MGVTKRQISLKHSLFSFSMNFLKKQMSNVSSKVSNMSSKTSYGNGQTFLHGHLFIEIREGKNLPDMEGWVSKLVDKGDVTDPFVDVRLGKAKLVKTSVILNDLNPAWNESYRIEVCHFADHLIFEIRDKDHAYSEFIGSVDIETSTLLNGNELDGWFDIRKKGGKKKGQLNIRVLFISRQCMQRHIKWIATFLCIITAELLYIKMP